MGFLGLSLAIGIRFFSTSTVDLHVSTARTQLLLFRRGTQNTVTLDFEQSSRVVVAGLENQRIGVVSTCHGFLYTPLHQRMWLPPVGPYATMIGEIRTNHTCELNLDATRTPIALVVIKDGEALETYSWAHYFVGDAIIGMRMAAWKEAYIYGPVLLMLVALAITLTKTDTDVWIASAVFVASACNQASVDTETIYSVLMILLFLFQACVVHTPNLFYLKLNLIASAMTMTRSWLDVAVLGGVVWNRTRRRGLSAQKFTTDLTVAEMKPLLQ